MDTRKYHSHASAQPHRNITFKLGAKDVGQVWLRKEAKFRPCFLEPMSGKPWRVTEVLCHRAWLSYTVCEEGANLKSWALWLPSYDHFPCAALSMHCPCISMPPHPRSPWHQNHPSFSMCLEAPGLNLHHEAKPLPWPHAVHISPERRTQI